jgi:hypothetical protein
VRRSRRKKVDIASLGHHSVLFKAGGNVLPLHRPNHSSRFPHIAQPAIPLEYILRSFSSALSAQTRITIGIVRALKILWSTTGEISAFPEGDTKFSHH